ncbi:MAG TPA: BON domain-containing protein [Pyrinomonadaceae bacterium]|jgi:hypothetical protein
MKKLAVIAAGAALVALAACSTETTTNTNMATNTNTTVANANTNTTVPNANTNTTVNSNARRTYNSNISEADYERDKERYGREAKEGGETIGQGLKDGWIWVKTKGALAAVDDLRDSTINVDVDNGVITLRGTVANAAQKAAAAKTANGIEGKKSVKDELKVAPADGGANRNGNASNANNANHK